MIEIRLITIDDLKHYLDERKVKTVRLDFDEPVLHWLPARTCLAKCGLNGHPQAWTGLCWSPALEAATHSLIILLCGILKAEGFGDGFSLAKHILQPVKKRPR